MTIEKPNAEGQPDPIETNEQMTEEHIVSNLDDLESLSPKTIEECNVLAKIVSARASEVTRESLEEFFQSGGILAVACDGEKIVGSGCVSPVTKWNGSAAELTYVAVLPAYENRGIATTLTSKLMDSVQAAGKAKRIDCIPSDDKAQHVYEKLGFRVNKRPGMRIG